MSHTHDVYRWNGSAFHIFPASDERPVAAICGTTFPDTEDAKTFWHHWLRQSGSLAEMQQWIVDAPLLSGNFCEGCQNHG